MGTINWQSFGLKKNPYDTLPLLEGGDIPIESAFVGRLVEREDIDSLLDSNERGCLVVGGNVGVGKTTLLNFIKSHRKYITTSRPLFSSRREIEASPESLNKRAFLLEIIGSIIREIQLLDPERIKKEALLSKLHALIDITQTAELSGGFSGGFAGFSLGIDGGQAHTTTQPLQLPIATIEGHVNDLVDYIVSHEIAGKAYSGLIIHMNNFDAVLSETANRKLVMSFFQEIRDILQTPKLYFFFLGPKGFFREIIAKEARIKAIFRPSPIILEPLTKSELIDALNKRMVAIKSDNVVEFIRPFTNEAIFELYDLYEGDVRSVLGALKAIVDESNDRIAKPLDANEATSILSRERWQRVHEMLTPEQEKVLTFIVQQERPVTQKDIITHLGKTQGNVAHYYFGPLKDAGIIAEVERQGNTKLWYLTQDYLCLKYLSKKGSRTASNPAGATEQIALL